MHGALRCPSDTADMISEISSSVPVPPGKSDKRVAEFNHLGFALRHIARHDQVVDTIVLKLGLDKKAWLHARHVPTGGKHAIGERTHQARLGSAVHQRMPTGANPCAKLLHCRQKHRVVAGAGAQIYGDVQFQSPLPPSAAFVLALTSTILAHATR